MSIQIKTINILFYVAILIGTVVLLTGTAQAQTVPPPPPPPPPVGPRAEIVVNVPPDAVVRVDGARTRSAGLTRVFVTPPLVPGYNYGYDLRISWVEGGRSRGMERHISFRAGDRLVVNLAQPIGMEPAPDLVPVPAAPGPPPAPLALPASPAPPPAPPPPGQTDYDRDMRRAPGYPNLVPRPVSLPR